MCWVGVVGIGCVHVIFVFGFRAVPTVTRGIIIHMSIDVAWCGGPQWSMRYPERRHAGTRRVTVAGISASMCQRIAAQQIQHIADKWGGSHRQLTILDSEPHFGPVEVGVITSSKLYIRACNDMLMNPIDTCDDNHGREMESKNKIRGLNECH